MTDAIDIRTDLRPGDLGRLIALHGTAYIDDDAHFGIAFEAHVAGTVAEFILENKGRGRVWLAEKAGELVGCAAMVDRGGRGQLRWVLVAPEARGFGLGKKLVTDAIDYAKAQGWDEVTLETTEGLDASMAIYRDLGFHITSEADRDLWNGKQKLFVMVKRFD